MTRTLKFIVEGQIIKPDPNCDFSDLVPGTEKYLQAEFSFSPEWSDYVRVATFWSPMGKEYPAQLLVNGKTCMIPTEALKRRIFKVQIVGKDASGKKMTTNKLAVSQNGGKT